MSRGYHFISALILAFLLITSTVLAQAKLPNAELAGMIAKELKITPQQATGTAAETLLKSSGFKRVLARYGRIVEGSTEGELLESRFSGLGSSWASGSPRRSGWSIQETGTITRHGRAVRPDSHQIRGIERWRRRGIDSCRGVEIGQTGSWLPIVEQSRHRQELSIVPRNV